MTVVSILDRGVTARPAELDRLFDEHERLGALCDLLETIADDLPRACPQRSARAAAELETLVPEHHAFEAGVLARLLGQHRSDLLARILRQHSEDEGLAFEIALALQQAAAPDPETLGYMLRCFFNNCRRSMLVEELAMRSPD